MNRKNIVGFQFSRRNRVITAWFTVAAVAFIAALIAVEAMFGNALHGKFFGQYALTGFSACILIIVVSKILALLLNRNQNYYDEL